MATDLSAYEVTGIDNPLKQVSVNRWNTLLGSLETAIDGAGGGDVTPQDFGAVGDGVTDDGPAFAAAIASLKASAENDATIYKGSNRLRVPAGNYFLGTTTLDITHTLIIEGEGSGLAGGIATKLKWSAGATGIRIQRYNTSGVGDVDDPTHYGGDATILRGLYLEGAYTDYASEGAYHAVHAKARFAAEDVFCRNWQGNGFNIVADAASGPPKEGNANCFELRRCTTWYCQNGVYIDGDDANAGTLEHCDFSYSREFGYWDTSALGNTVFGCHFEANGIHNDPAAPKAITSYLGNAFRVVEGQEVWASTNAPPATQTNNQGWIFYTAGGAIANIRPAWVSGMTWRAGGAAYTYGPSSTVNWISNYFEGGQADGQINTAGHLIVQTGTPDPRYKGGIAANVNGITVGGQLNATTVTSFTGGTHYLGPASGTVSDLTIYHRHTNNSAIRQFESYLTDGSGYSNDGEEINQRGYGFIWNVPSTCEFRRLGTTIFKINNNGVDIGAGKRLSLGGVNILNTQQAAIADATDAASTQARLNDLLAALRTHGLIAT